jgi:hypothetical protein
MIEIPKVAVPINTIPKRESNTSPKQINLEKFYSHAIDDNIHGKPGNTLSALPKGLQTLGNILFDVRGLVQLRGAISESKTHLIYPKEIKDIEVNQNAAILHFLQASAWDIEDPQKNIGKYIIHYEDNGSKEIPIIYKVNVWDWWATNESGETEAPVWKGVNERTLEMGMHIRLFKHSWKNPSPELKIISIDFISDIEIPAPILVAITLE